MLEGGGDDNALPIALVGVAVVAVGFIALVWRSTQGDASALVAGGLVAWSVLFAWRAGVAETAGANMFMAPLVAVCIPAAVVVPVVVRAVAKRLPQA